MKCSKCGYKVSEHIPGILSCVCSEHRIGSFEPYPGDWSRRGYRKWEKRKQEVRAAEQSVQADALPCGHNQGIEFGESSWSCVVCGQTVRR